jgi:spermidine synthase
MTLDHNWFTETGSEAAFSMPISAKLHSEQTPYQKLEIYQTTTFGKLMVLDNCIMLTDRDNFIYHEMMSHPALFSHAAPRRVVIIGGGDCGTLREVLKHKGVEHVLQVELDERVTRVAEHYFPELCDANHDPSAEFFFGDGIRWMKETAPGSVDVIIVDSTDPVGPAEGLFSEDFYRDCHRALGVGGIIVQQSESPLYHFDKVIKAMHRAMRGAGFSDTRTLHYPQCVYPSGWWSSTLGSKDGTISFAREADARAAAFPTRYYHADLHQACFVLPRFMREGL